jgi:hypothetical protein
MLLLGPEGIDKYIHCIIKNNTIILFCLQKEKYKHSAMEKFVPATNHLSAPNIPPLLPATTQPGAFTSNFVASRKKLVPNEPLELELQYGDAGSISLCAIPVRTFPLFSAAMTQLLLVGYMRIRTDTQEIRQRALFILLVGCVFLRREYAFII